MRSAVSYASDRKGYGPVMPGSFVLPEPNDKRYAEYRDSRLDGLKTQLLSPAPIYLELEEAALTSWLEESVKVWGAGDPFIRAAIGDALLRVVAKEISAAGSDVRYPSNRTTAARLRRWRIRPWPTPCTASVRPSGAN